MEVIFEIIFEVFVTGLAELWKRFKRNISAKSRRRIVAILKLVLLCLVVWLMIILINRWI